MRRYLAEHGTSFRKLLDEVRADLSKNYLMHSQMSIDQIAYVLGYTETTNFRRASRVGLVFLPRNFDETRFIRRQQFCKWRLGHTEGRFLCNQISIVGISCTSIERCVVTFTPTVLSFKVSSD